MPFVERITKAGKTIEVERYFTSRYHKKGITRGDNIKEVEADQKKVNDKQAERNLRLLLNENFSGKDYHLILTYKHAGTLKTREDMKNDFNKFIRKVRAAYKKAGIILKYVHVMEIGKKSARHHHIVISGGIDIQIIKAVWEQHGRAQFCPLDNSGQYRKLAHYLIKYTSATIGTPEALQGKRYSPSRNLKKPVSKYKVITKADLFKTTPTERKGYYIDKDTVITGAYADEYNGYEFIRYTLVKIDGTGANE